MYKLISILLMSMIAAASADVGPNVVMLDKVVNVRDLSMKDFQELNQAHISNIFLNDKGPTDVKRISHGLQYAGKINIGTPDQTLKVIFDIASADLLVLAHMHCKSVFMKLFSPTCMSHTYYSESYSIREDHLLWKGVMYPRFKIQYGKSSLSGLLIYDKVKVANIQKNIQLFGLLGDWNDDFPYSKADGILGIGKDQLTKFRSEKSFSGAHPRDQDIIKTHTTFTSQLAIKKVTKIGFHLYTDKNGNERGQLILGPVSDADRRQGELIWFPHQSSSLYWNIPVATLTIHLIGIFDGVFRTLNYKDTNVIPDPGTSVLAGPTSVVDEIHKILFKGMGLVKRSKEYGTFQFDCHYQDQLPILIFEMRASDANKKSPGFILEPKDYVKRLKDKCVTGFLAMDQLSSMVIGDSFLQKYYMVLDSQDNRIGFARSVNLKK